MENNIDKNGNGDNNYNDSNNYSATSNYGVVPPPRNEYGESSFSNLA